MKKVGTICECGMELRAPRSGEKALVATIKFHVKTEHGKNVKDSDIIKMLTPVKSSQVRGAISDIM